MRNKAGILIHPFREDPMFIKNKEEQMKKEINAKFHWREYVCEFFGTAILLYVGLAGVYLADLVQLPDSIEYFFMGLAFCVAIIGVFYSPLGKISGCHINPAVTIAFWSYGLMMKIDAFFYIFSQLMGAILGSWLVFMSFNCHWQTARLALTIPSPDYPILLILTVEAVLTFLLVLIVLSFSASDKHRRFTGVALGVYVLLATVLFAGISGASMNPARSFGPAILLMDIKYLWLYFIGPISGAMAAVYLFRAEINKKQLKIPIRTVQCILVNEK